MAENSGDAYFTAQGGKILSPDTSVMVREEKKRRKKTDHIIVRGLVYPSYVFPNCRSRNKGKKTLIQ